MFLASALAASGLVLAGQAPVAAVDATFVVTSTGDGPDSSIDGVCATSSGNCTLRAAIGEASAHTTGRATIQFAIPGSGVQTIQVNTVLPALDNGTEGITLDGFSQPGSSVNTSGTVDNAVRLVELVGQGAGANQGLVITGRNNVVRGLVLNRFSTALRIDGGGGNTPSGNNNDIFGNLIGLRADGSLVADYDIVTGSPCIALIQGAGFNRIGTAAPADRNTVSGCYEKGITLENEHTFGNTIQNNIVGLDPTGTQRRSNRIGIDVNLFAAQNVIGGVVAGEGNVVSGNIVSGIEVSHGNSTLGNDVIGNLIGTGPSGNVATVETRNEGSGIRLEGRPQCQPTSCSDDAGESVVTQNVVVNSTVGGIWIDKGFHDSTVSNNLIGVTRNGTVVGNGGYGIRILAAANNIIVSKNEIAGGEYGIQLGPRSIDPASSVEYPTNFNTFTENEIRAVEVNGIDLFPYGSVVESTPPLATSNEGIQRPTLAVVNGSVEVSACSGCVIELFQTTRTVGRNGLGEGYIATMTTSSAGAAMFAEPSGGWPGRVTATVTNQSGSTSEFSATIEPRSDQGGDPSPPPPESIGGAAPSELQTAVRIGNRVSV